MKKLILTTAVLGMSVGLYAQGVVGPDGSLTTPAYPSNLGSFAIDNTANINSSLTATSGGLFFLNGAPLNSDINLEFDLGLGASYGSATIVDLLLGPSGTGPAAGDGSLLGGGLIYDNSGTTYYIKGTTGGQSVGLTMFAWAGNGVSYSAALESSVVSFTMGLGNASSGGPGTTAAVLSAMPAVNVMTVPEPATFALAGLGIASLLAFRRRK